MRGCGPHWVSVSKGQHHQSAVDEDTRPVHDELLTAVDGHHKSKSQACVTVHRCMNVRQDSINQRGVPEVKGAGEA